MSKKINPLLIWILSIIFIDQLTKYGIVTSLSQGSKSSLIPHVLDLVHYRNAGAAFGMFSHWGSPLREIFFVGISLFAILFLLIYYFRVPQQQTHTRIPLLMILGGALGNLIDRFGRGTVVDFIFFHWYDKVVSFHLFGRSFHLELAWPAFNVADSAISVGVAWLVLSTLFVRGNHVSLPHPSR